MTADAPTPPDSLPTYIADGLLKQDDQTLQDIQAYIDTLLEHRSKPIEETDLPDEVEPIEDSDGPGTVVKEKVKCGDDSCRCSSGNPEDMHGPYLYRYYRDEGNVKSEYEGKP